MNLPFVLVRGNKLLSVILVRLAYRRITHSEILLLFGMYVFASVLIIC